MSQVEANATMESSPRSATKRENASDTSRATESASRLEGDDDWREKIPIGFLLESANDQNHRVAASDADFRFDPAGNSGAFFVIRI